MRSRERVPSVAGMPHSEKTLPERARRDAPTHRGGRTVQILAVLALAGIGAELLAAYAETTGDLGGVAFSLVFFAALYGAPALLARDLARRLGWGWPSMLCLFAALGVIQACLIDQSLFSADYGGYAGWAENREPTLIPALGFSGFNAYTFLRGHLVYSFAAPMALAEAWSPRRARTPWLGRVGTTIAALAYLLAALMILGDESSHSGSVAQLFGAGAVVTALVGIAVLCGRRSRGAGSPTESPDSRRRAPIWMAIIVGLVAGLVPDLMPPTWLGTALSIAVTAALGTGVLVASRRSWWTGRQMAAVAFGLLLERGLLAFTYYPLAGEVTAAAKYGHNLVMLLAVLLAGVLALLPRGHEQERSR